ncbi:MAG TPA: ATP-binding protein [Mycobacteriales bacterium]|nr:ATP-binding protein [Mycobacteriales bacterium]
MILLVGAVLARGGLDRLEVLALLIGLLVGLALVAGGVFWSRRVTAGLRELHADAVRRLRDPSLRVSTTAPQLVGAATEFAELARVLDALHLRARVADEVAEQARRTAEQTSAGVFELLSGLVAAEEATRGQLSAELHDTVAQSLAVARSLLAERIDPDPERMEKVRDLVEDAEEQVRAVMARARPAALNDGDLASAVGALRREFATRYLVTVRLSWPEQAYPLPLVSAVTVYRFFQEALLNVVKHADVDEADASLAVERDHLVAKVRDAGPGFVPSQVQSGGGRHVGLGLLRERARLAGGSLDVVTAPGEGTELTLRLPMAPRAGLVLGSGSGSSSVPGSPLRV